MNRILNSQSAAFAAYAGKLVAAFVLLAGILTVSSVEAANPAFTTTIPRGAQVGTEQKVIFYGDRLAAAELKRGGGLRDLYSAVAYGRLAAKDVAAI